MSTEHGWAHDGRALRSRDYDIIVVGAGIVGLTVALEVRRRQPSATIAVLEKEAELGKHASGRNSGVLHAGIYPAPDLRYPFLGVHLTRGISKRRFLSELRAMVPGLEEKDLVPCDKAGIRPQLVNTVSGKLEMDFIIEEGLHSTHVLNAISPAFTGAFEFAKLVADRVK